VAIFTTLIRLFVKRSIFWFDDVSRLPCSRFIYPENLLVDDEFIGMRANEHVIPSCSYGSNRYHKCVVNRDEL